MSDLTEEIKEQLVLGEPWTGIRRVLTQVLAEIERLERELATARNVSYGASEAAEGRIAELERELDGHIEDKLRMISLYSVARNETIPRLERELVEAQKALEEARLECPPAASARMNELYDRLRRHEQ
jgi:hypothetical protein